VIGLGVGLVCLWGVTGLKKLLRADDSLDVFGVHAIGGIFGALTTGIFNAPALGGPGSVDWATGAVTYPGVGTQFLIQLKAVCLVFAWTAVVAYVALRIVKILVGLRVAEEEEREGLDITSHGERAYDL
jgi:ammonium transporter, Amt family